MQEYLSYIFCILCNNYFGVLPCVVNLQLMRCGLISDIIFCIIQVKAYEDKIKN